MATLISELGAICARAPGYEVQVQEAEMLITVGLLGGRRQVVKVWNCGLPDDLGPVLRLQSRAAVVSNHTIVGEALRRNARIARASFALDTSVNPPVLDVVCGLVINPPEVPVNVFLEALHEVAVLADRVEEKLAHGEDKF